jgi:hypothetical protein
MRDWGEESALFLASSLRAPPPILSSPRPAEYTTRCVGLACRTQDPIVEARADDVQGHLDVALADVYAFVPQTLRACRAYRRVCGAVGRQDGHAAAHQIFAATRKLLGA